MFTEVKNIQLYDEVVSQIKEEIKKEILKQEKSFLQNKKWQKCLM